MRIGFFGGSFDPPHRGHLAVARAAAQQFALDEVLFTPVGRQPLKAAGARASFHDRMEMVRLLCQAGEAGWPAPATTRAKSKVHFAVSGLDGPHEDGTANYTVDALAALVEQHPKATLFSIAGADSFLDLRRWRNPERLLKLAEWIVVSRPDVPIDEPALAALGLTPAERARVHLLDGVHEPVSATQLRWRLAAGEGCSPWLPSTVAHYIRQHGLYADASQ